MKTKSRKVRLKDVCDRITVGHVGSMKDEYVPEGVSFLRSQNIHPFRLNLADIKFVTPEFHAKLKKSALKPGDVAVVRTGYPGTACVIPKSLPVSNCSDLVIISTNETELDSGYLVAVFNSSWGMATVGGNLVGVAQQHFNVGAAKEMELNLPDLPTQRKIAGILSAYNDLIENNLRRIKILEQMAQSLYREWFVHFRFPGHEAARFVDSPLGQIPTGWEVKAISDLGKVVTGKTPSKANEDFFGEDIPFLKTPDMHGQMFILRTNEYLSTAGAQSQANKTLPVGSICVSCIGTIGVVSITTEPCQTNQQINSVVLADEASREYLFFWFREAKQMLENLGSNGATMGNVNKSKFEGMKLVCPSGDLLGRFHTFTEPMFRQIEQLFRKIQNLRQTRDLLLPIMFNERFFSLEDAV
jgi:type I restriction enzyme, S subunit